MSKYKLPSLLCPSESVTEEQLETDRKVLAFDRTIQKLNRRGFLGTMAATAVASTFAGSRAAEAQSTAPPITDVLNFALNLEYLEANFYSYVTTGAGISTNQGTAPGAITGAPGKLTLDASTMAVAQALLQDEMNHIALLIKTITSAPYNATPISQPAINLAANGAITTQAQFLAAARQFTALGGSAYIGSAQYLVGDVNVLSAASGILGAEGEHAGAVDYLCIVQNIVSPAIDMQDVPPSPTQYFTVGNMALAPSRTTAQVLGVAYKASTPTTVTPAPGVTLGGFFPNGFNGNLKST